MLVPRYLCLLDKESGPTSFSYVSQLRKLFKCRRIGHAGTLDPFATGLMLYALGPACAGLQFLESLDKRYLVTARFGSSTDSYDRDGETIATLPAIIVKRRLESINFSRILENLTGQVEQEVPIYSAIKIKGKPLYAYARENTSVELPKREVDIELLNLIGPYEEAGCWQLDLDLRVSKGTYIRSFVNDLGEATGTLAHCQELRRLEVGALQVTEAHTMESLWEFAKEHFTSDQLTFEERLEMLAKAAYLKPISAFFEKYPRLELTPEQALDFAHGKSLPAIDAEGLHAVYGLGQLLGFVEARQGKPPVSKRVFYPASEIIAELR
ncbi:MAG: tRNA pseudouridine(55) synthase TruB [Eubacteriales bacterium]|nr:tRNA pseudouridine(55) synthase TruB [Eubacteriales bacterium]